MLFRSVSTQIPDVTTVTVLMVDREGNRGNRCWLLEEPQRVTITVRYSLTRRGDKASIEAAEVHGVDHLTAEDQRNLGRVLQRALAAQLGVHVMGWEEWWQHIYPVPYEPRRYDRQGAAA